MQAVVDHGFTFGFLPPGFDAALNRLSGFRQGVIDDGSHPAAGCGHRARVEIIDRTVAQQLKVDMRMHVNAAGEQILSCGIDLPGRRTEPPSDLFHLAAFDTDVGLTDVTSRDYCAVANDEIHSCSLLCLLNG